MVMGGDSRPEGRGFESWHCILDGRFLHIFVVKIVMYVRKDENKTKNRPRMAHIFYKRKDEYKGQDAGKTK